MWASSFSDFAKRAQEAAELAAKTAESFHTAAGSSLFNLDSMQDKEDTSGATKLVSESNEREGSNMEINFKIGEERSMGKSDDSHDQDDGNGSDGEHFNLKLESQEQDDSHISNQLPKREKENEAELVHKKDELLYMKEDDLDCKFQNEDNMNISNIENTQEDVKHIFYITEGINSDRVLLVNKIPVDHDDSSSISDTVQPILPQSTGFSNQVSLKVTGSTIQSHKEEDLHSHDSDPNTTYNTDDTPNVFQTKNSLSGPFHLVETLNVIHTMEQDLPILDNHSEATDHGGFNDQSHCSAEGLLSEDDEILPLTEVSSSRNLDGINMNEKGLFNRDKIAKPLDLHPDSKVNPMEQSFSNVQENLMNISMMNSANVLDSEIDGLSSNSQSICNNSEAASPSDIGVHPLASEVVDNAASQDAVEKFMLQLERIHKEHEAELKNMERQHKIHMDELREQLKHAETKQSKSAASMQAIANHDKCLTQLRNLEKEFNQQLEQKDELISQMNQQKMIMEHRIRELMKSAEDKNQTLEEKSGLVLQINEKNSELEEMIHKLKSQSLELSASQESYSSLKERVKVVASELKERRAECRNLSTAVDELNGIKLDLESEKNELEAKLYRLSSEVAAKDQQIESMSESISRLSIQLEHKDREIQEKEAVAKKSLLEYKKKAQASLSDANARAAAANQSKEDAEFDAASAKAEAVSAKIKLEEVCAQSQRAVDVAQKEVHTMKHDIEILMTENAELLGQLSEVKETLQGVESSSNSFQIERDALADDCKEKAEELLQAREMIAFLERKISQHQLSNTELKSELAKVKEEQQMRVSEVFNTCDKHFHKDETKLEEIHASKLRTADQLLSSENDSAINLLRQELLASNEAIIELKEALANALSRESSVKSSITKNPDQAQRYQHQNEVSDSNPLIFAFEKQSELRVAREEIARLVEIIGESELSKSVALEELEYTKQKMNEAESRLRRYEKLGQANTTISSASISRTKNSSVMNSKMSSQLDSVVNLEYLKNIILRFMNATTLNEKKALVPVIAAVLELTADEQSSAMKNVEKSAGITGVGTSLIESVQSKGIAGLFG